MVTLEVSMIDSKETARRKRILRAVFGLSRSQVECFEKLREIGGQGTCVQNLVDKTQSERSVEQKKLKKLLDAGLVSRKSLTLSEFNDRCRRADRESLMPEDNKTKGYLYIYSVISDAELMEKMQNVLASWVEFMNNDLSRSNISEIPPAEDNAEL